MKIAFINKEGFVQAISSCNSEEERLSLAASSKCEVIEILENMEVKLLYNYKNGSFLKSKESTNLEKSILNKK